MKIKRNIFFMGLLFLIILISYLSFEIHLYEKYYKMIQMTIFSLILICFLYMIEEDKMIKLYIKNIKRNKSILLLSMIMSITMLINGLYNYKITLFNCITVFSFTFNMVFFYILLPVKLYESENNIERLIKFITIISTILSIISIIIYLRGSFLAYKLFYNRSSSIFFDPNFFAVLAAAPIFINIESNKKWIISSISLFGVFTAGSRGTLISVICTLVLYYTLFFKTKPIRKMLIVIVVLCVLICSISYLLVIDFFRISQGSNGRIEMLKYAIELIHNKPILGYGYATIENMLNEADFTNSSTHNSIADFTISFGLIATILYLYIIIKSIYSGIKNNNSWNIVTYAILLIINMNTIVYSFGGLGITSMLFTMFLGLAAYRKEEKKYE